MLYRFGDPRPQSIAKNNKNCAQVGFGISESEFLKLACGKEGAEIIDLSTGKVKMTILGAKSADFAIPTRSRKRFALAWMDHSRAHTVRQYLNPFTYIAALGTCCDDPGDLFRLRVFDQESGYSLADFRWKISKNEAYRIDEFAVALSPDGEYAALLRGTAIEVYRIPQKTAP